MTTCMKHETCKNLARQGAVHSAAVVPLLYYQKNVNQWVMGLGLENAGTYKDQYNLCAGKGEKADDTGNGYCWLNNALRELYEEFTISVSWKNFDSYFRGSAGRIRVFIFQKTPIFIMLLPPGFSRQPIKAQMTANMRNRQLTAAQHEMRDFEFIKVSDGQQIEGRYIPISSFADAVRKQIDPNIL